MHVYVSMSPDAADVFANQWSSAAGNSKSSLPHFVWENITYGDFHESRTVDLVLDVPSVGTPTHRTRDFLMAFFRMCRTMDHFGRTSSLSRMEPALTRLSPTLTSGLSTMRGNVRCLDLPSCASFSRTAVLTRYLPKTKIRKVKNLLGGSREEEDDELEESQQVVLFGHSRFSVMLNALQDDVIVSHWHPVSHA